MQGVRGAPTRGPPAPRASPRRGGAATAAAADEPARGAHVGRQGDRVGHEGLAQRHARKAGSGAALTPAQARAAATVSPVVAPIVARPPPAYSRRPTIWRRRRATCCCRRCGAAAAAARARLRAERGRRRGEPARARRAHHQARRRGVERDPQARRLCGGERARRPPEHAGGAQGARQVWDPAGDAAVCRRLGAREAAVRPRRVRARGAAPRAAAAPAPAPVEAPPTSLFSTTGTIATATTGRGGDSAAAIGDDRYVLHNAERTLLPHREGWRANAKIVDAHGGAQPDVAVRCIFRLPSGS